MVRLYKFWEANFLKLEFLLSGVLSLLFCAWSEFANKGAFVTSYFADIREPLYGALVALFGSLLGFSITAVSIVLGYANSDKLEIVRKSSHYSDLWNTFRSAIKVLALATISALVGLIFDKDGAPNNIVLYFNVFMTILSFFRIGRCVWVFEYIIAIVTKQRK